MKIAFQMCKLKSWQYNHLSLWYVVIKYLHLRGFGFVFSIEELWQGSALNGMNTREKNSYNTVRTNSWDTSE